MKLGDVLKKEREKKGLSLEETANGLEISVGDYENLEGGESDAEKWGPLLAEIAILLETPTSRLLADSGRAQDTTQGQAGTLISQHRQRKEKTLQEMAEGLKVSEDEYTAIEAGESPIEVQGPLLLRFAEVIEQPVFNLFYPCGLPFAELDDYP